VPGEVGLLVGQVWRISGEQPHSRDNLGGDIARGAASTVLSAATGGAGLPGQVANGAAETAINARTEGPRGSEDALLLDPGAGVDVFVRRGF